MSAIADTDTPADGWAFHLRRTLALALPLAGAQLAQMAINVTDTLMIGRLGAVELAGAVLGTQIYFIMIMGISGFAVATVPLVARADAAGDAAGVRRSVRMGLWVVTACSLVALVPMWATEAIYLAIGQEPQVAAIAGEYVRIVQWGILPATVILVLRSALSALERAQIVLVVTLLGVAVNAALDYVLIFGKFGFPALGVQGAAVASLGTMLVMCLALMLYVIRHPALAPIGIFVRLWRPDWPGLREVVVLGLPISAAVLAEIGLFSASAIMMGWIGTIELAAHGIALQIASIAFMVPYGISQAATVRVGRAVGRNDPLGVGRAGWVAMGLALACAAISAVPLLGMPSTLAALFLDRTDPDTPAILAYSVSLLALAAAFQLVDQTQVVAIGLLRGLRDTAVPMAITLVSYWAVGMPAAWVLAFPLGLGGPGIWAGLALGLAMTACLLTGRFALRRRLRLPGAISAAGNPDT